MSQRKKQYDVIIIGGGLSGLTAAHELSKAGSDFLLLEAAPRLGGRVDSLRDPESGLYLGDLGPSWVWPPYQSSVRAWLQKLDFEVFPQFETGDALIDVAPNTNPRRQFLPGQHGMVRLKGGPHALVDALAASLPEERLEAWAKVTKIDRKGKNLTVRCEDGRVFEATRVICACPLRLMHETVDFSGLVSDTCLSIMQNAPTWMATQAKATVVYDKPFWRDEGLSGRVASRVGPMVEVHDHCGPTGEPAALFGFIGLPHNARSKLNMRDEIITQLVRCFGQQAASPRFLEVADWHENELICSTIDQRKPQQHPALLPHDIREPQADGQLLFAVAETAEASPGLIDGAFEAGQRAARLALRTS